MISFESDYTQGAHEKILERLAQTNREFLPGYGEDVYCVSAKDKIRAWCAADNAQVHFLTGGTQTNQIVIDSLLEPFQGVLAAQTGHIAAHEAGAIEFTGHKVLTVPHHAGKLDRNEAEAFLQAFYADENREHMVYPGMIYLSFPTEYGTLYSKKELSDIYDLCKRYGMTLYIDGARLGYGLASRACDLAPGDLPGLCDVFTIGGTKVGALCGEAVVFTHGNTPPHFVHFIKKHGALLAKGRLLGVQFDTLFTDDLYGGLSRNAIDRAEELKSLFAKKNIPFYLDSPTNQQFVVLENERAEKLKKSVRFAFWEHLDAQHTVYRFATGWATTSEEISFLADLL